MIRLELENRVRDWCSQALGIAVVAGLSLACTSAAALSADEVKVSATYGISFSGFKIGHFQFNSKVAGKRYELTSDSRVKLLFGAFKFNSQSRTVGTVRREPRPQAFKLNYRIKKKHKSTTVQFARGNVVKLENNPRVNYSSKYVALKPEHLAGVVDPMTAIMQMTRSAKGNPCQTTAEIFDGRRRMRLQLSPKGRRRIKERKPSGQPAFGYVCRIKFTPIAGHKKSRQINYLAGNKGIEIVLRPVPSANLVVPYEILIPTMVGTVAVVARSINIVNGRNQRIAMKY